VLSGQGSAEDLFSPRKQTRPTLAHVMLSSKSMNVKNRIIWLSQIKFALEKEEKRASSLANCQVFNQPVLP